MERKRFLGRRWLLLALALLAFLSFPCIGTQGVAAQKRGGALLVLRVKTEQRKGRKWTTGDLQATCEVLRKRLQSQGVAGAVVTPKPPDHIEIKFPRLKSGQSYAQGLLEKAELQVYLLPQLGNRNTPAKQPTWDIRLAEAPKTHTKTEVLIHSISGKPVTQAELQEAVFSHKPVVTGADLLPKCRAALMQSSNIPIITFEFNAKAAKRFENVTRANLGAHLAVFLDKQLLTAPTINAAIPGKGVVEGSFTLEGAQQLANQLNAGALPAPLEVVKIVKN